MARNDKDAATNAETTSSLSTDGIGDADGSGLNGVAQPMFTPQEVAQIVKEAQMAHLMTAAGNLPATLASAAVGTHQFPEVPRGGMIYRPDGTRVNANNVPINEHGHPINPDGQRIDPNGNVIS